MGRFDQMATEDLSLREKLHGLYLIATFRPLLTLFIVLFSAFVAVLEGIGLSFIMPIVEVAQGSGEPEGGDGIVGAFVTVFDTLGVPFTLGYIVVGVSLVMTVRFSSSIVVAWLRVTLQTWYVRDLQQRAFRGALDAHTAYFDREGSDDIINAIVTQAEYAGKVIRDAVRLFGALLMILAYLAIAFYISPLLTVLAGGAICLLTVLVRNVTEAGYTIGDRVADANEGIQQHAQAGTQGIREVKLLGLEDDLYERFSDHVDRFTEATIRLGRNEEVINNVYNLSIAVLVFGLIYVSLTVADLTLATLGVFLFAMFQIGPKVSQANKFFYKIEGRLPHLIRTQRFIEELESNPDVEGGDRPVPDDPTPIEFDDVSFAYDGVGDNVGSDDGTSVDLAGVDGDESELVLEGISFTVDRGEFVAFVGQSGAGKSTIAALLARIYAPDSGAIRAAGRPIEEYDVDDWRDSVAFVRQDPYMFNDTLRTNVTVANPDCSRAAFERACRIAQVTEFVDDLPEGYDTMLGDDGVRLSGGQRQRVALARAILEDAPILVLDEATSDLDATIERRVQRELESLERDRTIVAIAHRLSTVRDADRIFTLEDGRITERGQHGQLLDREGTYADLYAAQ